MTAMTVQYRQISFFWADDWTVSNCRHVILIQQTMCSKHPTIGGERFTTFSIDFWLLFWTVVSNLSYKYNYLKNQSNSSVINKQKNLMIIT